MIKRISILILTGIFCLNQLCFGFQNTPMREALSGHAVSSGQPFRPLHLRYLSYDFNNNFRLFIDKGNLKIVDQKTLDDTTKELLSYFFIGLSLPNKSFWVNLKPNEQDNVIDPFLAQTDLGKVLLESDLQLKKDAAVSTSPKTPLGKEYWERLFTKAKELQNKSVGADPRVRPNNIGQAQGPVPTNSLNIPTNFRVWIVPDEIIIRETNNSAYIYKATLKVLTENEYNKQNDVGADPCVRPNKNNHPATGGVPTDELQKYCESQFKELIIPKLTQEVNCSKKYASLRQVYYSLIFSQWYKARFKDKDCKYSKLIDTKDLTNLCSKTPWSKDAYFNQYQKSLKDGEYNYKESVNVGNSIIRRSYFSGGVEFGNLMGNAQMPAPGALPQGPITCLLATGDAVPQDYEADLTVIAGQVIVKDSGKMHELGPWLDEDIESAQLASRHAEFEGLVAGVVLEPVYGQGAHVVYADLGNIGGYHFVSKSLGLIIVVNSKYKDNPEIQEEAKFHEARERFWMSKGFTQHEAHIITWQEQIKKFAKDKGSTLTPYQAEQLANPEIRRQVLAENKGARQWQWREELFRRANEYLPTAGQININEVKQYEDEFIKQAQILEELQSIHDNGTVADLINYIHRIYSLMRLNSYFTTGLRRVIRTLQSSESYSQEQLDFERMWYGLRIVLGHGQMPLAKAMQLVSFSFSDIVGRNIRDQLESSEIIICRNFIENITRCLRRLEAIKHAMFLDQKVFEGLALYQEEILKTITDMENFCSQVERIIDARYEANKDNKRFMADYQEMKKRNLDLKNNLDNLRKIITGKRENSEFGLAELFDSVFNNLRLYHTRGRQVTREDTIDCPEALRERKISGDLGLLSFAVARIYSNVIGHRGLKPVIGLEGYVLTVECPKVEGTEGLKQLTEFNQHFGRQRMFLTRELTGEELDYSDEDGGKGLGMNLLWHIVVGIHGGSINVRYDEVNNSLVYTIKLPKSEKSNVAVTTPTAASAPAIVQASEEHGGIDFMALPIVTQAISNLRMNMAGLSASPAADRIRQRIQESLIKNGRLMDRKELILYITKLFRQEEQTGAVSDLMLRDILIILETVNSESELKTVFLAR